MRKRLIALACLGFGLSLGLAPPPAAARDFADGLAGGPDYWRISNLCLSRKPVLREAADPRAPVLDFPAVGAVVRNKGCRIAHRQRWCAVETLGEPVLTGWIEGGCLREAPPPGQ
jgi:hypothetical protein